MLDHIEENLVGFNKIGCSFLRSTMKLRYLKSLTIYEVTEDRTNRRGFRYKDFDKILTEINRLEQDILAQEYIERYKDKELIGGYTYGSE